MRDQESLSTAGSISTAMFAVALFVPGHMFGWLVEWVWLGLTIAVGTLYLLNNPPGPSVAGLPQRWWITAFGLLSVASFLSVAIAVGARGIPIEARDISELLRWPIYGLLGCIVAAMSMRWSNKGIDRTLRFLVWYVLCWTLVYALRVPVLYELASSFLYMGAKTLIEVGFVRVSIPFENPNFLGFFMLFVVTYFMYFRPRPLYLVLSLIIVFLTGSRSSWLACAPLLFFGGVSAIWRFSIHEIGVRTVVVWATPAVIAALIATFWQDLQYFSRLTELAEALQTGGVRGVKTADIRFNHIGLLLDWFEGSPALGWGPGRALALDIADNQYVSWLVNWGAIGAATIIAVIVSIFATLLASARRQSHFLGCVAIGSSFALMIFTGDFLENYRLFFLFLLMLQAYERLIVATVVHPASASPFQPRRLVLS